MVEFIMGQDAPGSTMDATVDKNKAILNYIVNSLRATRPWTRLLSILGFIGAGFSILAGLAMIVGRNFFPVFDKAPPLAILGIIYAMTSVFYLVPSIWLSKYSSAISSFLNESDAIQLAKAIAYQKSFWKFVGIVVLVLIAIGVLGIITAILIPTLLLFQG
jgi:flagellar biosynthesis protein FlhB